MGVPVVTLAGKRPISRAGGSQLSHLGLTDLIARDEDEYVQIAIQLAGDVARLTELRGSLRERMEKSVLMDASHFALQVEAAYRAMWRHWCEMSHP
jgi:predicted O-linked N-acetylglucosamine transferase (SPINDLY family)